MSSISPITPDQDFDKVSGRNFVGFSDYVFINEFDEMRVRYVIVDGILQIDGVVVVDG